MSGQLWRAVAVYRIVTLCYAAVVIFYNDSHYAHPAGGLLALVYDRLLDGLHDHRLVCVAAGREPR